MISVVTEYPSWYILLCIVCSALLTTALYFRNKSSLELLAWQKIILPVLRFLSVFLISFLLLSPLLKTVNRVIEKPIILIAQDASESMALTRDSLQTKKDIEDGLNFLVNELSGQFEIRPISFSDNLKNEFDFDFSGKQTDYSAMFRELNVQFENRNVGAMVLVSDGIFNKGSNPLYYPGRLPVPLFTVAAGDTVLRKDAILVSVKHNETALLNNTFPVEIGVEGRQLNGLQTEVIVEENGIQVLKQPITFNGPRSRISIPLYLQAKKKGIQKYAVRIKPLDGEASVENNRSNFYVEVKEAKQKILILADSPHPDLAALSRAIESSDNYEVVLRVNQFEIENPESFSMAILHGLPGSRNAASLPLITRFLAAHIPLWFIVSTQTDVNAFSQVNHLVQVSNRIEKNNELRASLNSGFNLFDYDRDLQNFLAETPPLIAPFGEYRSRTAGTTLLFQRIGSVSTEQPLLFLAESDAGRNAVLAGEGLWKWRLKCFQMNNNFNLFDELILKVVQYVSLKELKNRFAVKAEKRYDENEPVTFRAEVFNESMELTNQPDVFLTITGQEGARYNFTFSKSERSYFLQAGYLPPGEYRYNAKVTLNEKQFTVEGTFIVNNLQVEQVELLADHQLLNTLSTESGGKMFYPGQWKAIRDTLLAQDDMKPVSHSEIKLLEWIHLKWIFFILVLLLTIEWFIRKYHGGY